MTVEYSRLDIIRGETAYINLLIERTLQIIAASKDLLAVPVPNTFCGQKTQEPFPQEAPRKITHDSHKQVPAPEQPALLAALL